jgi:hypothetical protein
MAVHGNHILGPNDKQTNTTDRYMITGDSDYAWAIGGNPTDVNTPTLTKAIGNGQLGVGVKAPALDVATPLVLPPAVIVVLQVPTMYTAGSQPTVMGNALKDMFESHAKQVSGIDISYTLDTPSEYTLHDGQSFQAPGKTKRGAVNPNFVFQEITGNLYWNIIRKWVTDINNPDTYSMGAGIEFTGGWTMSAYSMTIAVIQPDVTQRPDRILDCAIICNMFPQGTGEFGVSREISSMKAAERSFTFTGIQQHNYYTKQIGKLLMQKISMHSLDFNWAPPQRDIWTTAIENEGLMHDVAHRKEEYPAPGSFAEGDIVAHNKTRASKVVV